MKGSILSIDNFSNYNVFLLKINHNYYILTVCFDSLFWISEFNLYEFEKRRDDFLIFHFILLAIFHILVYIFCFYIQVLDNNLLHTFFITGFVCRNNTRRFFWHFMKWLKHLSKFRTHRIFCQNWTINVLNLLP